MSAPNPLPRGTFLGRYRLVDQIGHGGMANVYLATRDGLGGMRKLLVVKVLQPRHATDHRLLQLFLAEARLAARPNHPNVVQAVDGVHGLEVLGSEAPDVIITDINMPRMDGFGVIENVRKDDRHRATPILVLTTESDAVKDKARKRADRRLHKLEAKKLAERDVGGNWRLTKTGRE